MSDIFEIPYVGRTVEWLNNDYTIIIGENGSGKTLLLGCMMDWCNSKGYDFVHYDAVTALHTAYDLIECATNQHIIFACKALASFSIDFKDDIIIWAKKEKSKSFDNCNDQRFMKDARFLRSVLRHCGNGYTRMIVMLISAYQKSTASYYFLDLPETSLHIVIVRKLINFIMHHFRYMKVIVATHSPEVIVVDNNKAWDNNENLIILE